MARPNTLIAETVEFPIGRTLIEGDLRLPEDAVGLVVFAHGSARWSRCRSSRVIGLRRICVLEDASPG